MQHRVSTRVLFYPLSCACISQSEGTFKIIMSLYFVHICPPFRCFTLHFDASVSSHWKLSLELFIHVTLCTNSYTHIYTAYIKVIKLIFGASEWWKGLESLGGVASCSSLDKHVRHRVYLFRFVPCTQAHRCVLSIHSTVHCPPLSPLTTYLQCYQCNNQLCC